MNAITMNADGFYECTQLPSTTMQISIPTDRYDLFEPISNHAFLPLDIDGRIHYHNTRAEAEARVIQLDIQQRVLKKELAVIANLAQASSGGVMRGSSKNRFGQTPTNIQPDYNYTTTHIGLTSAALDKMVTVNINTQSQRSMRTLLQEAWQRISKQESLGIQ